MNPDFTLLENKLKAYSQRTNFEDIRQDAFLALLSGKPVSEAITYAIRNDNRFWSEKKQENKHIYTDDGECRDEEVYFRTDREDGETGSYLTDVQKEMVKKIHEGVGFIRFAYPWTERPNRKHPYSDYDVLKRFMKSGLGFLKNHTSCKQSFYIKKGNAQCK